MEYKASRSAADELGGLIYWAANLAYTKERYSYDEDEIARCRKSIEFSFSQLDKLGVPFWVQNAALCWAENWKNYTSRDFWKDMTARKIYRAA